MPVQHLVAPAVYLDHWALRCLSSDSELSERFVAGLARQGGTLALSWANIGEFRNVSDTETVQRAEEFVEANLPRVFCLEVNPFTVIDAEARGHQSPVADAMLLGVL